ncbi:MAG: lipopolysaccharide heptosyltransferase I [Sulfurimonas sp.]|uniref:lipopolysaccharide heptosyltransferase I n=1 Tax=Sulfurimonas sp. TaxID=2022749 RepID=UPI00262E44E9|nr:lipopolysaccharide heptosyltransferase I [Sulfurimonas sp.]MCW8896102.1 lipopolysaccharide heptosyltransferase I [Sulfurimonas sp.]MCW8954533.1 lipopolysaccharide heptosyltransferase I [Sulfurimonas sp.]MCW9067874.1 lipopolysaccharide heptosyltransferase I [Sulfurimonas sp.]
MKICIVKLSAMGDIIHAMVALQFIKQELPDAKIDWVVESGFKGILENNPHIDNILAVNIKSIKKKKSEIFTQYKILKTYSKNNYDIVIDAQGLLKSAIVSKIIGAKIIAGFDKDSIREGIASIFYNKKVHIPYDANTIDRNATVICKPLGIEVTSEKIINKEKFLFSSSHVENLPDIFNLFVIGSTWESRNYPKEKFVEIAKELKTETYIVWGSEEEHQKALWMQEQSKYLHVLPKGSLNDLKYVISKCNLLIGNDTGPTHMAWGLNIPSITIFGPTPINRVYITPINKVIKSSSKINHYRLNKNDFSIYEIEVAKIVKIANKLQKSAYK